MARIAKRPGRKPAIKEAVPVKVEPISEPVPINELEEAFTPVTDEPEQKAPIPIPTPPKQRRKKRDAVVSASYNERTRQHLVNVNGIDRWLTTFQVEIVLRDRDRKVIFPDDSKFMEKPSETKRPCKDC